MACFCGALLSLCLMAYWWAFSVPLISDDYLQVWLARQFAKSGGWKLLVNDALYRCRATSLFVTYWTTSLFGVSDAAFTSTSLLLHVLNACLVAGLGGWKLVGPRVAAAAAAFYVVCEGHQEAVVWYAALPEQLVFLFILVCFLCWLRWLETGATLTYVAAWLAYLLALLSKESAVAVAALMLLPVAFDRHGRRALLALAPFAIAGLVYAWAIFAAGSSHLHLHDGTFSFAAPVFSTWLRSFARLLWFWGLAGIVLLWAMRTHLRLAAMALMWIAIGLAPYSFLTYMPRIPSRHRYLADVGVALIVGSAFTAVLRSEQATKRRWLVAGLASAIVLHNCSYLWLYKRAQFLDRARPTEAVLQMLRNHNQPVVVECFPYPLQVAQLAVELVAARPAEYVVPGNAFSTCTDRTVLHPREAHSGGG